MGAMQAIKSLCKSRRRRNDRSISSTETLTLERSLVHWPAMYISTISDSCEALLVDLEHRTISIHTELDCQYYVKSLNVMLHPLLRAEVGQGLRPSVLELQASGLSLFAVNSGGI
jgi:hypothetical protein